MGYLAIFLIHLAFLEVPTCRPTQTWSPPIIPPSNLKQIHIVHGQSTICPKKRYRKGLHRHFRRMLLLYLFVGACYGHFPTRTPRVDPLPRNRRTGESTWCSVTCGWATNDAWIGPFMVDLPSNNGDFPWFSIVIVGKSTINDHLWIYNCTLVGGLEHGWILTFHILGILIATDRLSMFLILDPPFPGSSRYGIDWNWGFPTF